MGTTTVKECTNCRSQEIDELMWVNQITGDIMHREDQYHCQQCQAKVEVVLTTPRCEWIEDIEPLKED
jgi:lipopolysaccharide biosynthesis regulator YciM